MTKTKLSCLAILSILVVAVVGFAGAALAQPAGAAPAGGSAAPAAPAGGSAAPAAGEPAAPVAPPAAPAAPDARAACVAAMNADPKFAAAIVKVADEKAAKEREDALLAAHTGAYAQVQKNERHVIYSYAAMWIIAVGFVLFLWRRQNALKLEIAGLHRELEAAARETRSPGRT